MNFGNFYFFFSVHQLIQEQLKIRLNILFQAVKSYFLSSKINSLVQHHLHYIIKLDWVELKKTNNPALIVLLVLRFMVAWFALLADVWYHTCSAHLSCLYPNQVATDLNSGEQEIQRSYRSAAHVHQWIRRRSASNVIVRLSRGFANGWKHMRLCGVF